MQTRARVVELARMTGGAAPVVSVYLNTRWADEHQRQRVRVFLKNEIRKAREQAAVGGGLDRDLDWIETEGQSLIDQDRFPGAHGVAIFACAGLGLREVLPLRVAFEDALVVAGSPFLRPLAALLDETPSALVVFLDAERARLIPLGPGGHAEEVVLEHEVPGRHRRGGWAQLAQSRYQRHIEDHRDRHFEAVAQSLAGLVEGNGTARIVMAGERGNTSAFIKHLPRRLAGLVVGSVAGSRHDPTSALLERAADLLGRLEGQAQAERVDAALTEAAKSRQAVAGLEETLEAVNRGAVHRLYMLRGFAQPGAACGRCGALQREARPGCRLCGEPTRAVDLGEAMAERVIATGGSAGTVELHRGLAAVGGVAALLRYPL